MIAGRASPFIIAVALSALAYVFSLTLGETWLEQAGLAARYTSRVGFPLFILVYSASSLVRLWPNDFWKSVLRRRRQLGLAFAFTHSVHLAALTYYLDLSGESRPLVTLLGGGLAYGLLYAMALTSNDWSQRTLGVWWKRLHTLGIHWLWFVYATSYLGRLLEPERMAQGLILFPVCIAALALRLAAWAKARARRNSGLAGAA